MATLPAKNVLDGSTAPSTSTMKTAMGQLRDFLAGLLGADGTAATARDALGLPDGTWTPTLTNTTNVSASTAFVCNYHRLGDSVSVSGRVSIDPVATGTVVIDMSLPVASNFTSSSDAGGCLASATTAESGGVYANSTDDLLRLQFQASQTAVQVYYFSAQYRVKT